MKSWGSVVPELTFLNRPWEDLSLDPHSSRAFMPEGWPLPLHSENLDEKHIVCDGARVLGVSPRVAWHSLCCQLGCDPHCSPSLSTFAQPLTPSSWQIMEIKGLGCSAVLISTSLPLSRLLLQSCYTGLLSDFWGHAEGMRCVGNGHKIDFLMFVSQLQNAWYWAFFSNTVLASNASLEIIINNTSSVLLYWRLFVQNCQHLKARTFCLQSLWKTMRFFFFPLLLNNSILFFISLHFFKWCREFVLHTEEASLWELCSLARTMCKLLLSRARNLQSHAPKLRNFFSICSQHRNFLTQLQSSEDLV